MFKIYHLKKCIYFTKQKCNMKTNVITMTTQTKIRIWTTINNHALAIVIPIEPMEERTKTGPSLMIYQHATTSLLTPLP